jgi:hypothetical protein
MPPNAPWRQILMEGNGGAVMEGIKSLTGRHQTLFPSSRRKNFVMSHFSLAMILAKWMMGVRSS